MTNSVAFSTFRVFVVHYLSSSKTLSSHSPAPSPGPWQLPVCFLTPGICLFWTCCIHRIMQRVVFRVGLLSLGILHTVACVSTLSLWPRKILLSGWTTVGSAIHPLRDVWCVSTFRLFERCCYERAFRYLLFSSPGCIPRP